MGLHPNQSHPTYRALIELGKALRTIFLCEYLGDESIRQEVNKGLSIIEDWNDVNDFIFFGNAGKFVTNKKISKELSVLALHLLQNCLVFMNTLLVQAILKDQTFLNTLTGEDYRALTPLIFNHINPYGTFILDMNERLSLQEAA